MRVCDKVKGTHKVLQQLIAGSDDASRQEMANKRSSKPKLEEASPTWMLLSTVDLPKIEDTIPGRCFGAKYILTDM